MVKVVFVCLGNICRSPMAEGIFKKMVQEAGLEKKILVDSAGTAAYHIGDRPDPRTLHTLSQHNTSLDSRARQFRVEDFEEFDYILTMDRSNYANVMALARQPADEERVYMMRSFQAGSPSGHESDLEVPDPYYGKGDGFELVYDLLVEALGHFLAFVKEEHHL